ncbi:MAG: HD domain-containing protein [Chloroflexota bacterium]|nr:HD domain-containing protein [Chloroflexota bacterium]
MPTIIEARSWYPDYDPAHGFAHIRRVYDLCERLGQEEGADLKILRAAALLHDAKSGADVREEHHIASAEFAEQVLHAEGWSDEQISAVQHCIRAHRFRDQTERPQTIEAQVLFDADKLDAIGAVGVIRVVAYAILHEQEIYVSPSEQFLSTGERELGEPHTPRHEFIYKLQHIEGQLFTPSGKALARQRHHFLVHFFQQFDAEINGLR